MTPTEAFEAWWDVHQSDLPKGIKAQEVWLAACAWKEQDLVERLEQELHAYPGLLERLADVIRAAGGGDG